MIERDLSAMGNEAEPIRIAYPSSRLLKQAFKVPIPLWRMGLGFPVGRLFMILTTTGRKSGRLRHTAIEFHEHKGRKYIYSAFGEKADWYKNFLADPHVTIQTASGAEHMMARRLTDEKELAEAFEFVVRNPTIKRWVQALGFRLNLDEFVAQKAHFYLVTFDPTHEPTPRPLEADLKVI
jgi:deazaflavin-dependent oxidoreductase (nitroreductase family)